MAICFSSLSNAQVAVDPTTGNLIDSNNWSGVTYGIHPGDCCTGGPQPLYDTSNNTINFSYGNYNVANLVDFYANPTLSQPGLKITGYNYSWTIKSESQNGLDPVNASVGLYSPQGTNLENYNYSNMYSGTYSGGQNFTRPYTLTEARYLQLNFQAVDSGFWAGYYGPQVSNISLSARYTIDPCALNPLYASHCAGFNDVITSGNLVPNPGGIATWGQGLNNSFAISTALQHSGSGVMVHGFNWGYDLYVGNTYCADWLCTDWRDPDVTTNVNIRNSAGASIYSVTRKGAYDDKPYWQAYDYSLVLPQSLNSLSLGTFEFSAQTKDQAGVMNMRASIMYTPDQCVIDPLSSESCPGYQQAYFTQQCSINALYDQSCPGYQQAYFDQQCSINALYDQSCPGYQQAYFTQQCSISGLYSTSCPNYAQAYLDQQCAVNQLFSTQCPGYSTAYAQKMLEEQSKQAAAEEISPSTSVADGSGTSSTSSSSSAPPGTEDATRVETAATTDVGGVELSSTGSVSVPDGVPQTVKEAAKETSTASSQPAPTAAAATSPAASTPGRPVNAAALAVANRAVAEAAGTAQRTAEAAVAMSQSENANPSDGTGATVELGGGLTLQGLLGQGLQADQSSQSNQQIASISTGPIGYRSEDRDDDRQVVSQVSSKENSSDSIESSMIVNQQNVASIDKNTASTAQETREEKPQTGPSVRRGGRVEGMEGGADMNSLAAAPADFNTYLNAQLRDSQFYSSREIYRGQRNVDNVRALRGLGTDRLHQEMVNQQYKIGQ